MYSEGQEGQGVCMHQALNAGVEWDIEIWHDFERQCDYIA